MDYRTIWNEVKDFADQPVGRKYSLLTGLLIVVQALIIIHFNMKLMAQQDRYEGKIETMDTTHRAEIAVAQAKTEACNRERVLMSIKREEKMWQVMEENRILKQKIGKEVFDMEDYLPNQETNKNDEME